MSDFSALTREEVFAALCDDSSPVAKEIERLMIYYSDALVGGADPHEIILPGPDTPAIESVAMFLMHEALNLGGEDEKSPAGACGAGGRVPGDVDLDEAIAAAGKTR